MDRQKFENMYGFVPILDTRKNPPKRRSINPILAADAKYMEKHGFILIEAPEIPMMPPISDVIVTEKPKRGRPKKQK